MLEVGLSGIRAKVAVFNMCTAEGRHAVVRQKALVAGIIPRSARNPWMSQLIMCRCGGCTVYGL